MLSHAAPKRGAKRGTEQRASRAVSCRPAPAGDAARARPSRIAGVAGRRAQRSPKGTCAKAELSENSQLIRFLSVINPPLPFFSLEAHLAVEGRTFHNEPNWAWRLLGSP